jgi:hypothetical protein
MLSVLTLPKNAIRRPPFHSGTTGPGFLLRADETTVADTVRAGERVQVVTAKLPKMTVVYTLSPDLDHRIREVEYRTPEGARTFQLLLSDYKLIDGVPVPFKSEQRQWSITGQLTRETLVSVESARVNVELPRSNFILRIPAKTGVTVSVDNRRAVFQTGNYEQSVSLEHAPLLGH